MGAERQRLLGIQFARGLAALLVAFYHGSRMIALPQYAGHVGFGNFFSFGHSGVDFFFVLSGFIIFFVHHADLGRPERLSRYIWRRLSRIYPSYWLILAVVVIMLAFKRDPALTPAHFLRSLLLLPDSQEPLLGVSWTLVFEMIFYTVFALGIVDLRLGAAAATAWIVLVVTGLGLDSGVAALKTAGATRNLQFLMGIAAAHGALYLRLRVGLWLAALGVAGFFATGMMENAGLIGWDGTAGSMIFGAFAAVAVLGVANAERDGQLRFSRAAEFFGGTSYLLYLVHTIMIGMTYKALTIVGLASALPDSISVTLAVAISVATACLLYRFFERPIQNVLQRGGGERLRYDRSRQLPSALARRIRPAESDQPPSP
jgi:exopolysaccharide production protein ExoZ